MSEQSVHSSACQSVFLLLLQGEGSGRGQVGEEGELGGGSFGRERNNGDCWYHEKEEARKNFSLKLLEEA